MSDLPMVGRSISRHLSAYLVLLTLLGLGFVAALASDGAAFDQALPVGLAQRHLSTLVKAPEDQEAARRHPRLA